MNGGWRCSALPAYGAGKVREITTISLAVEEEDMGGRWRRMEGIRRIQYNITTILISRGVVL